MKKNIEGLPKLAVITVSDKGYVGKREDRSGKYIVDYFTAKGWEVSRYVILPDEKEMISKELADIADNFVANLILTTGGTGFSQRDVTPEATRQILEKDAPGFSELIRIEGHKKTPRAILSRGVSGIRKSALIINLPGSLKGVKESLDLIYAPLLHGVDILLGRDAECGIEISPVMKQEPL